MRLTGYKRVRNPKTFNNQTKSNKKNKDKDFYNKIGGRPFNKRRIWMKNKTKCTWKLKRSSMKIKKCRLIKWNSLMYKAGKKTH